MYATAVPVLHPPPVPRNPRLCLVNALAHMHAHASEAYANIQSCAHSLASSLYPPPLHTHTHTHTHTYIRTTSAVIAMPLFLTLSTRTHCAHPDFGSLFLLPSRRGRHNVNHRQQKHRLAQKGGADGEAIHGHHRFQGSARAEHPRTLVVSHGLCAIRARRGDVVLGCCVAMLHTIVQY